MLRQPSCRSQQSINLDENELSAAMKLLDKRGSGYIEFDEFVDWWVNKVCSKQLSQGQLSSAIWRQLQLQCCHTILFVSCVCFLLLNRAGCSISLLLFAGAATALSTAVTVSCMDIIIGHRAKVCIHFVKI